MSDARQLNQSLLKGMKILECLFVEGLTGIALADICEATGLSTSTAWRLLHTLKQCGWVVEAPAGHKRLATWRLTAKPAHLAASFKRHALDIVQGVESDYQTITGESLRNG